MRNTIEQESALRVKPEPTYLVGLAHPPLSRELRFDASVSAHLRKQETLVFCLRPIAIMQPGTAGGRFAGSHSGVTYVTSNLPKHP